MSENLHELIKKCRELKAEVGIKNIKLDELKEKLREIMIDSGLIEYDGIEIRRSFSLDIGWLKMKHPELAKKFVKEETITTIKDVIDKKALKKHAPEIYKECLAEGTARLYGL